MNTVSIQDLQHDTVGLLARVEAGEHLVVSLAGRPVAELRPISVSHGGPRPHGLAAGQFVVPDDFDASLPTETLQEFEGP